MSHFEEAQFKIALVGDSKSPSRLTLRLNAAGREKDLAAKKGITDYFDVEFSQNQADDFTGHLPVNMQDRGNSFADLQDNLGLLKEAQIS